MASNIFLKFCPWRQRKPGGQDSMSASSFSLHHRPSVTDLFKVMLEQKDADATMKCSTTLSQGKWQGQKEIKVAYTLLLTSFSGLYTSPCAFTSKYEDVMSFHLSCHCCKCPLTSSLELPPTPISHLLLHLCSAISQHRRLSSCHSISPKKGRVLLCVRLAQCSYIPAWSPVHTCAKP